MRKFFSMWIWVLCLTVSTLTAQNKPEVNVHIDLNVVNQDRVMVTVTPPATKEKEAIYFIPKIVPGTYSEDNYGQFIDNLKAYDKKGNSLPVARIEENAWKISQAHKLTKLTYWVNDTFDVEDTHDIFSPSGTNILENENFLINTHAFIGYFKDTKELPYRLEVTKPVHLYGATAMEDLDPSEKRDEFLTSRYAELVDNPIMYSRPDITRFMVDDMEIIISVYSPNGLYNATSITESMEVMMKAQKTFLGSINDTKKYAILLYLSDYEKEDAQGFGALEHNTSTVVVFPEAMNQEQLVQSLIDVVSHEFFHIVTPLSIHSKEIHYFDFNEPKMSRHLWLYEGVTEYFANLFQINQGLIDEDDFYNRIAQKIMTSRRYDDKMPFTKMSAQVLQKPYKDNYYNVYEKGALIAMCLDIKLRELSNGKKGILDLMKQLSDKYGPARPFDDDTLFDSIVALTYPEIRNFLDTYIAGPTPIPYADFFEVVGVGFAEIEVPGNVFIKGQSPYITINPETKEIVLIPGLELPEFYQKLGMQGGDTILGVNGTDYNLDNVYDLIMVSQTWQEGAPIFFRYKREGTIKETKGTVLLPKQKVEGLQVIDTTKNSLRQDWLKG